MLLFSSLFDASITADYNNYAMLEETHAEIQKLPKNRAILTPADLSIGGLQKIKRPFFVVLTMTIC